MYTYVIETPHNLTRRKMTTREFEKCMRGFYYQITRAQEINKTIYVLVMGIRKNKRRK